MKSATHRSFGRDAVKSRWEQVGGPIMDVVLDGGADLLSSPGALQARHR
ncbi:hypothetical protein [Streptomyces cahuitamycinicus]|nr:hypothetical protein [Streptomyces cahuitamycinicus]